MELSRKGLKTVPVIKVGKRSPRCPDIIDILPEGLDDLVGVSLRHIVPNNDLHLEGPEIDLPFLHNTLAVSFLQVLCLVGSENKVVTVGNHFLKFLEGLFLEGRQMNWDLAGKVVEGRHRDAPSYCGAIQPVVPHLIQGGAGIKKFRLVIGGLKAVRFENEWR